MARTGLTRMRWRAVRFAILLLALAGAIGLGACGGDDGPATSGASTTPPATGGGGSQLEGLSATEVLDRAKKAAKAARSVRVVGEGTDESGTTKLDLTFTSDGGSGTVERPEGKVEVVLAGNDVYVRLDEKALAATIGAGNEEIAKFIGGRWIKAPADSPQFSSFAELVNLAAFIDGVLSPEGQIRRVDGKDISGTPTVGLQDEEGDGGILYIADSAKPYPLRVDPGEAPGGSGAIIFSDWDEDVTITPPPAGEVIDSSKLPIR